MFLTLPKFFKNIPTIKYQKCIINIFGEMAEWFKAHAWKVCVLVKGTVGSNPTLSAILIS